MFVIRASGRRWGRFNAINIPVDELRARMAELPKDKEILVACQVGFMVMACRMLSNCGFRVRNLSGIQDLSDGYRSLLTS